MDDWQITCEIATAMGYEMEMFYADDPTLTYIMLERVFYQLKQVNVYDFKPWDSFVEEFLETEVPGPKVNSSISIYAKSKIQKPIRMEFKQNSRVQNWLSL